MHRPNRITKLKRFLWILAPLCFVFFASSCMMSRQQVAENALFRQGEIVKYEIKTGDQFTDRLLTDDEVDHVKQILRIDQRSWNRSVVSYFPQIRIKSGKSDINITNKSIIINFADSDGASSQYVAECDDDTHARLIKLIGK